VPSSRDGSPIFTFIVQPGVAEKSFGLHVASLAGLPRHVLERANELYKDLEEK